MSALIAFVADLLKLPPAVVGGTMIVLGFVLAVTLLSVSVRTVFRYLERRSDNKLIETHLASGQPPQSVVIQAIRGTAIADAAQATTAPTPAANEAEIEGAVKRAAGWLRDLKLLPPGG